MNWFDLNTISSLATAAGVLVAASQLLASGQQAKTEFEDSLFQQYREIVKDIPVMALLGKPLAEGEYEDALDSFYYYIDLTNEQVRLRQEGRIREATWKDWCDGIKSNLNRPAFQQAWEEIKEHSPHSFEELRRLEDSYFMEDPLAWRRPQGIIQRIKRKWF